MSKADPRRKGFQYLALLTKGDLRNEAWQSVYSQEGEFWESDNLIVEMKRCTSILWQDPFFKNMKQWGFSISNLINERAAQAFLAISHKRWKCHDRPRPERAGDATKRELYWKDMRMLFDRYLYEHMVGAWTGGADQRIITEIEDASETSPGNFPQINPAPASLTDEAGWVGLLTNLIDNGYVVDGVDLTNREKKLTPKGSYNSKMKSILVYHAILKNLEYPADLAPDEKLKIDVEHIIPKNKWKDYLAGINEENYGAENKTHSLGNLCLLGSNNNRSKGDKTLTELTGSAKDQWILAEIARLGGVPIAQINTFSQPAQYSTLLGFRREFLIEPFRDENRLNVLTNDSTNMYTP
jgi:hypothetical protein